jgi:hypothetical protein
MLKRVLGVIGAVSILGVAVAPAAVSAGGKDRHDRSWAKVLAEGLNSPKGLAINHARNLIIGQGAFGPPGPALEYILRGPGRGTTVPVSPDANLIDVAISPVDDTGWGISNGHLFHLLADGSIGLDFDIAAYQVTDPDPYNSPGDPNPPEESNPYGLTVDQHGNALFVDAANNDLVRVTPDGVATTLARFDVEMVSTDHIPADPSAPPEEQLPPALPAEAVPTTVAVGPDGSYYVGELKGFPFRPGSSNIWRIKPWADGALCSVNTPSPESGCKLLGSGFTAIQDIAFNRHTGKMYVLELAEAGVLAFEAGLPGEGGEPPAGPMPPAVLIEVKTHSWNKWHRNVHPDQGRELARGQLFEPGGVVVDKWGTVYVTDGIFTGGRLLKIVG